MSAVVLLRDIVDALEMQLEESSSFLDPDTGRIETVSDDLLRQAKESLEKEPDLAVWQKQEREIAKRIVATDCFLKLPDKFDVHEWAITRTFRIPCHPTTFERNPDVKLQSLKKEHSWETRVA